MEIYMKTTIKLAVASASFAAATSANAGIVIPAGDWTLDINGNVNAYATWTDADKVKGGKVVGGIAATPDAAGESNTQSINTGLLPAWIGFSGKTRQNDLDVAFTISMQPNVSDNSYAGDSNTPLNRQAFITFGDKSWGSIKLGKDIGIFAQDAILNDMTLLGVGGAAGNSGTATTLGGIGTGYIYAAWKGQIAYTSPNWNGFSFTAGITNPNQGFGSYDTPTGTATLNQDRFGFEGKAQYEFAGDVAGKVWASAASYDVTSAGSLAATNDSYTANAWDIGANVNVAGFGLTGYYYDGKGAGTTVFGANGAYIDAVTGQAKRRDSNGGYLQGTYTIPGVGTKIGVAYGVSKLDTASGETIADPVAAAALVEKNERWTVGAYHPLTKHLNLVAEYNRIKSEAQSNAYENESDSISAGAILFF
jgi:predicted porin